LVDGELHPSESAATQSDQTPFVQKLFSPKYGPRKLFLSNLQQNPAKKIPRSQYLNFLFLFTQHFWSRCILSPVVATIT
jgi:hypothetical protein